MKAFAFAAVCVFTGLIAVAYIPHSGAMADSGLVGNWTGVVTHQQRYIVVTLTVNTLQLGRISGDMRWGTPRACSLQTEYSGTYDGRYAFNIAGSNGGWCDMYRDGSLSVEMHQQQPRSLSFTLADRQGGGVVEGHLATEP
jgi:hypothetical protein